MKAFKRLFALLLAAAMLLALSSTVLAEGETYKITIENATPGHVYEAYQVFKGELSTNIDGRKTLSNVEWGDGLTAEGQAKLMENFKQESGEPFEDELDMAASLTTEEQIKTLAKLAAPYLQNPHQSGAQEGSNYVIADLEPGFYLVKDKNDSLDAEGDDFYTAYIMRIVGDATAAPKGEKPTLTKEIKRNNGEGAWGVAGDNQIGDTVEFRITTSIPDTTGFQDYANGYDYIIHDTMSAGLTSHVKGAADVTIKINDGAVLDQAYYTVTVDGANANKFDVKVDVLAAVQAGVLSKGDKLFCYYTAQLNEKATAALTGKEENGAHLEYSNNPGNTENKGKTPEKYVYEWTYQISVGKINPVQEPLTGAKFVLSKDGSLKAADFKCTEDGVPTEKLDALIPVLTGDAGAYTINPSADGDKAYVMEGGTFSLKGLDDDTTYYLYETKSPVGYNLLKAPVAVKIEAAYNEDGSLTAEGKPTLTVDGGEASTTLSTNIVNKAGAVLPETGGIGTTIFYVVGALLVAGAVVALVFLRKRSEKSER